MSEIALGKIIEGEADRDAIHIAVAPVVADENLYPGQPITFTSSRGRVSGTTGESIGIVDPFLRQVVPKDKKFWAFLHPGTVTGMRHHWAHPAFSEVDNDPEDDFQRKRAEAERWLREYAIEMNPYSVNDYHNRSAISNGDQAAFDNLIKNLRSGDMMAWGSDLHSFADLRDADDLKKHAEIYLGYEIHLEDFEYSCSC